MSVNSVALRILLASMGKHSHNQNWHSPWEKGLMEDYMHFMVHAIVLLLWKRDSIWWQQKPIHTSCLCHSLPQAILTIAHIKNPGDSASLQENHLTTLREILQRRGWRMVRGRKLVSYTVLWANISIHEILNYEMKYSTPRSWDNGRFYSARVYSTNIKYISQEPWVKPEPVGSNLHLSKHQLPHWILAIPSWNAEQWQLWFHVGPDEERWETHTSWWPWEMVSSTSCTWNAYNASLLQPSRSLLVMSMYIIMSNSWNPPASLQSIAEFSTYKLTSSANRCAKICLPNKESMPKVSITPTCGQLRCWSSEG